MSLAWTWQPEFNITAASWARVADVSILYTVYVFLSANQGLAIIHSTPCIPIISAIPSHSCWALAHSENIWLILSCSEQKRQLLLSTFLICMLRPHSLRWKNKAKHCSSWFVVREKHCSDWKNKLKSTDYKTNEHDRYVDLWSIIMSDNKVALVGVCRRRSRKILHHTK